MNTDYIKAFLGMVVGICCAGVITTIVQVIAGVY